MYVLYQDHAGVSSCHRFKIHRVVPITTECPAVPPRSFIWTRLPERRYVVGGRERRQTTFVWRQARFVWFGPPDLAKKMEFHLLPTRIVLGFTDTSELPRMIFPIVSFRLHA